MNNFESYLKLLNQLLSEEDRPKKKIGYMVKEKQKAYAKRMTK